jgi:hypothetical protein
LADLLRLFILVPLAYILACIAAGATVAVSLFGAEPTIETAGFFAATGVLTTLYAGAVSFVPALIAVLVAEAFGWRSLFFYLIVGGGIGLAADALTEFVGAPALADYRLALYLAAGFVAGFVYWLIAGRLAGLGGARPRSE